MKIEIEIPEGEYCHAWGKAACPLLEESPRQMYGRCRLLNEIVVRGEKGQCRKSENCPLSSLRASPGKGR